ncbi:LysR substrate-binding domain-containing protein [Siccirubricoccus deserti]
MLAVGVLPEPPALYTRLRLLPEAFCTLMRPGHPLAEGTLTVERFANVPHLLHSPNGSRDGALDATMTAAGHPRRLGAVVAHLSAVPEILQRTDMIITLSARLACQMSEAHGLVLRDPPVAVQHTRLSLIFHRRFEADPGHAWLRRLILAVARRSRRQARGDMMGRQARGSMMRRQARGSMMRRQARGSMMRRQARGSRMGRRIRRSILPARGRRSRQPTRCHDMGGTQRQDRAGAQANHLPA